MFHVMNKEFERVTSFGIKGEKNENKKSKKEMLKEEEEKGKPPKKNITITDSQLTDRCN